MDRRITIRWHDHEHAALTALGAMSGTGAAAQVRMAIARHLARAALEERVRAMTDEELRDSLLGTETTSPACNTGLCRDPAPGRARR